MTRSPYGSTRRDADKQALLRGELATRFERILVSNRDDLVVHRRVKRIGNKARTDTLNLVSTRMAFGENRGSRRLDRDDLHVGVLRLQVATRAGNRATRANTRNEDINLALGIPPNLRASRRLMNCRTDSG